jgi:hypothetical protein
MAEPDDKERASRIELMKTQIDLLREQRRWEPFKALAVILTAFFGACVIFVGSVFVLSNWISRQPQTINVHLDAPLTIAPK